MFNIYITNQPTIQYTWSQKDGVTWSEPRVGAFNSTIKLLEGSTVTCERRERPQVIMTDNAESSSPRPLALVTAVTGCPVGAFRDYYRGDDDSFTLVQMFGWSIFRSHDGSDIRKILRVGLTWNFISTLLYLEGMWSIIWIDRTITCVIIWIYEFMLLNLDPPTKQIFFDSK